MKLWRLAIAPLFATKIHGSIPSDSDWDLRTDIEKTVNEHALDDFDLTGLYEKYISNQNFHDKSLNAISSAGYISEKLLKKYTDELLRGYPDLISRRIVPNHPQKDRTYLTQDYQTVL